MSLKKARAANNKAKELTQLPEGVGPSFTAYTPSPPQIADAVRALAEAQSEIIDALSKKDK